MGSYSNLASDPVSQVNDVEGPLLSFKYERSRRQHIAVTSVLPVASVASVVKALSGAVTPTQIPPIAAAE